ncbi:MotA/TolQ/ExbB proton channel family protein [Stieleria maiorica]|uniref:MotA/TolQ/ExbB proton channel family protein n=1 Tax=Stieleria maiorica TaxID=2795974 RepID=A0A5B9MQQ5_9BACT|nr:MotA/TolQ/ExbB proton channel family protein [Stieleria maiorica]QEG02066.1 MotA/TolQ/ExbB proton channel family protein [Stieleria maiorica]
MSKTESQNAGKFDSNQDSRVADHRDRLSGILAVAGGGVLAGLFYGVVYATSWGPLERYFLGHPVAIAATILFCIAVCILGLKAWATRLQWALLRRADDAALSPKRQLDSPTQEFRDRHDAGFVAQTWSSDLAKLPREVARCQLVVRLREVLMRQSGRGTTKHLADDLRELSSRDADSAHDSFALVRIIVWAIPMLGFLGTVIGITQTLGGLDFSNGNAAVDNLKSGLYVAFDTTALGLVLSIVAIFLQFPVERSEQQLLAAIDERVGYLTGLHLPGDEVADNQFELLAQLCEGVRAAVAESLSNQTTLWRQTIDEAQGYWQQAHNVQSQSFVDAVEQTLTPALRDHAQQMERSTQRNREQLEHQFDQWQLQLAAWQETIVAGADAMTKQHAVMLDQVDQAALVREQASSVLNLQQTLAANLNLLDETNRRIDENMGAAAGQGMADAMIVLARAVDVLTREMVAVKSNINHDARRAA